MRLHLALPLVLLPLPALAWEFSADPTCTLSHQTADLSVAVTYDPALPEPYAIALTLAAGAWPVATDFAIRFEGPAGLTIGTRRHVLSDEGRTVTVTDQGFGNVLAGIGRNDRAVALMGGLALPFPLDGADAPLAQFLDCPADALS
jgi:hypothetical protein